LSNGDYTGREQTLVKHIILRNYLERFAIIVGSRWNTLTYVDCFSGPWNVQSENFQDSSFAIALEQLRKAREIHKSRTGRTLKIRCFFLEKKRSAYEKLKRFTDQITDVEIEPKNKALEDAIPDILDFVKKGGSQSFSFVFIDPTGWTGFAMSTIAPLLQLKSSEVLINFMTEHIRRFIDSPQQLTQESFMKLFGSGEFKSKVEGLTEKDREDALVAAYIENVKTVGSLGHASSAIVLHPNKDRTHFHLIYATRDLKGIEVFKEAEKKAMRIMEVARGEVQKREREERTGQTEFGLPSGSTYFRSLRERYTSRAKAAVSILIQAKRRLAYDEAWALAMTFPLTWKSDLNDWIREWERDGQLETMGMQERQRVPQLGQNIHLVWTGSRIPSSKGQPG
jgi:three-Cys-motif partner protein